MDHATLLAPATQLLPPQGNLFAVLPSRPRAYKSELEEEFMSPREQRHAKRLPH